MVYQQNINSDTRLGVWHITETESFFTRLVSLQREITHPHKKLQHLAGRYLLKELFPDFPHELIKIATTRKPFLENEAYHFSISHCSNYAAVLVSRQSRAGVDVELISPKAERIKHKFLSVYEQQLIAQIAEAGEELYSALVTAAWGIKESLYKWYGEGEVDFIEHLNIERITLNTSAGTAFCKIVKGRPADLKVNFFYFNDTCVAWVLS